MIHALDDAKIVGAFTLCCIEVECDILAQTLQLVMLDLIFPLRRLVLAVNGPF